MAFCPNCRNEISAGANHCTVCNSPVGPLVQPFVSYPMSPGTSDNSAASQQATAAYPPPGERGFYDGSIPVGPYQRETVRIVFRTLAIVIGVILIIAVLLIDPAQKFIGQVDFIEKSVPKLKVMYQIDEVVSVIAVSLILGMPL